MNKIDFLDNNKWWLDSLTREYIIQIIVMGVVIRIFYCEKKNSEENLETIKKLKSELNNKNDQLVKLEYDLHELDAELLQIKNNFLKKIHE